MEIRLGDLYELIVRIVDDRLRQYRNSERIDAFGSGEVQNRGLQGKISDDSEKSELQTLREQLKSLLSLQQQTLETVQANQRRIEAILNELLTLLRQQIDNSKMGDGRRANLPSGISEASGSVGNLTKEQGLPQNWEETITEKPQTPLPERKPPSNYRIMSLPNKVDYEIPFAPSDNWLEENLSEPVSSELAPDGVSLSLADSAERTDAPSFQVLTEQLSELLKRLFGIEVDYLHARQTLSSPSLQNAQILLGEGFHNGQPITLTIFGKSHISPTDITIFYNAVVRPLKGSVTEPVVSLVFGETFEPKALKIAHALNLLVVNLKDLQNIGET